MMGKKYNLDATRFELTRLQRSIQSRDLIPSRKALKAGLEDAFSRLNAVGIGNLRGLLDALKNEAQVEAVAKDSGLDVEYLTLLRREANSYLPKPVRLSAFPGIQRNTVEKLKSSGITNTKQLFERAQAKGEMARFCRERGISPKELTELAKLSDLARLYGVGPVFARMLYDLGIDSVRAFVRLQPREVISLYEEKSQKKADFTESDIEFSLELAKYLDR